jgi:hypothetical protein
MLFSDASIKQNRITCHIQFVSLRLRHSALAARLPLMEECCIVLLPIADPLRFFAPRLTRSTPDPRPRIAIAQRRALKALCAKLFLIVLHSHLSQYSPS